ncbi:MAG: hypothetical protein OXH52_15340 [Gammaproteobacteria bacterium]|nr:hypothetical protein [Gammaproteobacteria bacterium]
MRPGWRNAKHGKDWLSSMERFALPRDGKLPVSEVTNADVVDALRTVLARAAGDGSPGAPTHQHGHGVGPSR